MTNRAKGLMVVGGICIVVAMGVLIRAWQAHDRAAAVRIPDFPKGADRNCYEGMASVRLGQVKVLVNLQLQRFYGNYARAEYAQIGTNVTWWDIIEYYGSRMPSEFKSNYDWFGVEYEMKVWSRESIFGNRAIGVVLIKQPYPDSFLLEQKEAGPADFQWLVVFDVNRKDELEAQHSSPDCVVRQQGYDPLVE